MHQLSPAEINNLLSLASGEAENTLLSRRRRNRLEAGEGSEGASGTIPDGASITEELWLWDAIRQKWYWWSEVVEAYVYEDGGIVRLN